MATAPEMLKSVSGIDLNAFVRGLTSKNLPSSAGATIPVEAVKGDIA
jgi:flotillin